MSEQKTIPLKDVLAKITPLPWSTPHFAREEVKCNCGFMLCNSLMGAVATVHKGDGENEGDNPLPPSAIANAQYLPHAANVLPWMMEAMEVCIAALQNAPCGCSQDFKCHSHQAIEMAGKALTLAKNVGSSTEE